MLSEKSSNASKACSHLRGYLQVLPLQRTTSSVSAGGALLSAGASPALGAANPSLSLSRPQAPRPTLRSASQPAQLRSVSPLAPSQIDASAHSQVTVARGPGAHPP